MIPARPHPQFLLIRSLPLDRLSKDRIRDILVSAQDGLEAVRLSLAAIESIRTGRPVFVAGL